MKALTPIILFSLAGLILSADCTAHPLKGTFSFITQQAAAATTGINFCKGLQTAGTTCCTAATINTFQTQIDTKTKTLVDKAVARDTYIVTQRDTSLNTVQDALKAISTKTTAAITNIDAMTGTDASTTTSAGAKALAQAVQAITKDATDNLATLKTNWVTYQKARAVCINLLLKIQANTYCLACDSNWDTYALTGSGSVSPSTVALTLDADLISRIKTACFPYAKASDDQSSIILAQAIKGKLTDITTAFTDLTAATPKVTGKDGLKAAIVAAAVYPATPTSDKAPSMLPAGCAAVTDAGCDALVSTFFTKGLIQDDALIIGGPIDTSLATPASYDKATGTRLLEQGRMLLTNWNPATDDSGVTTSFPDDPANPDSDTPSGSELMKSGLISLIVVMVSAFLI